MTFRSARTHRGSRMDATGPTGREKTMSGCGIPLSGGPVRFSADAQAIFVRDPDRNVIELHQRR